VGHRERDHRDRDGPGAPAGARRAPTALQELSAGTVALPRRVAVADAAALPDGSVASTASWEQDTRDTETATVGALDGRRLLVTGGSSGIGAATARAAAAAGARVALLARREGPLTALARELDGVAVPADVTDAEAAHTAVDRAAEELGGLDGVVNAAGLVRPGDVATADPASWRAMFDVNVLGLLHVTQPAIAHLRTVGGGDVVNVSSMSGRRIGSTEMATYAASKAAVHALSEGLRRELQPDGIRVAVVAPGLVDTPIFEGVEGDTADRLRDAVATKGLPVGTVADAIVRILAAPPELVHVEVAMLSIDQG
jgi:NADP-dependent 3-hydroxy acid dehydrogenase YdfG